ncbi:hypothetical protein HZ326_9775 [Fusarium oxysporum f. sp. albedinis]|nr:hypothetical protein HZ326_9775 [Fusarium oxysporum f. sp. albedinis]
MCFVSWVVHPILSLKEEAWILPSSGAAPKSSRSVSLHLLYLQLPPSPSVSLTTRRGLEQQNPTRLAHHLFPTPSSSLSTLRHRESPKLLDIHLDSRDSCRLLIFSGLLLYQELGPCTAPGPLIYRALQDIVILLDHISG